MDKDSQGRDIYQRLDEQRQRRTVERLMLFSGAVALVAIIVGTVWLFSTGALVHWVGYAVAILVAAGLASIRAGTLGAGLLLTALLAFLFGGLGLIAGLALTVLFLLAKG